MINLFNCRRYFNWQFIIIISFILFADDNRDLSDHAEDDLKRQRNNYNGDQLYSNVSYEKNK